MKLSMMFILSLVLTLSMTDGFILRAEKGGRALRKRRPYSMDLQTRWIPDCSMGCSHSCVYTGICYDE
uniref:Conotoxin-like unassigned superfamily 03 n=1 Tax=Conus ermineus TaxID=55423 RepID=A0A346CIG3_CONER|nr:conotoxin-like precursor unassigned superfamily 03 [Conus ermineus]